MNSRSRIAAFLSFAFFTATLFAAGRFTDVTVPFDTPGYIGAGWADLDQDNDLDLLWFIYPQNGEARSRIYRNDAGQFTEMDVGIPYLADAAIAFGDYDRDGRIDIALRGQLQNPVANVLLLVHNEGDLRFQVLTNALPAPGGGVLDWGDFDGDGDLDLAGIAGSATSTGMPAAENLGGTFRAVDLPLAPGPAPIPNGYWLDTDGDGDTDIAGALYLNRGGLVSLELRNQPGDRFVPFTSASELVGDFGGLVWCDFDLDGDLDAAGAPYAGLPPTYSGGVPILIRGPGTNLTLKVVETPFTTMAVSWVDVDNDGDWDLAAGGVEKADLFINQNGEFTPEGLHWPVGMSPKLIWADYDSDGDQDLLLLPQCFPSCHPPRLLRNESVQANRSPSVPTSLTARSLEDGSVRIDWQPSTDPDSSNPFACTYDLRVGTSPGGVDIVSPPADPVSGQRRRVANGAARRPFWILRGLPTGTYYASVQAVDTGFAGSAWAPGIQFTVTNTAPTVAPIPQSLSVPDQSVTVEVEASDAESPAESLSLTVFGEDSTLLPPAGVSLEGRPGHWLVTLTPPPGQYGETRVQFRVSDPQGASTTRILHLVSLQFAKEPLDLVPGDSGLNNLSANVDIPPTDWDEDGDLDLLVSGLDSTGFWKLRLAANDGQGHFLVSSRPVSTFGDLVPNRGLVADFDRDGHADIMTQGNGALWRGLGDGTFELTPFQPSFGNGLTADFDQDGIPDLLWNSNGRLNILFNDGNAGFRTGPLLPPGVNPETVADLTGDGIPDLLVLSNGLRVFPGLGEGAFDSPRESPWLGDPFARLVFDADDDGDLDVVLPVLGGVGISVQYTNDGHGSFTGVVLPPDIYWDGADFNNDGRLDRWQYRYWSDGVYHRLFTLHLQTDNGFVGTPFETWLPSANADFDGDGDLDVIVSEQGRNEFGLEVVNSFLARNRTATRNLAPAPPSQLSSTVDGAQVHLFWAASTDDHTPSPILTYNVRVGSAPGRGDLVSPLSDLKTGTRRLQGPPNAGNRTRLDLLGLPVGDVYWSVQAIDGQGQGSAWAPEMRILVDRPDLAPLADFTTPVGAWSRPMDLRVSVSGNTPVESLVVQVLADDERILPSDGWRLTGTGTERQMTVRPGAAGQTRVTLRLTDAEGRIFSRSFKLRAGLFESLDLPELPPTAGRPEWVDVDGDGRLDLMGAGDTMLLNEGDGRFRLAPLTLAPVPNPGQVLLGDLDGDNLPDVLLNRTPEPSGSEAGLWRNAGNRIFNPIPPPLNDVQAILDATDQDRDGLSDLALWGGSPRMVLDPARLTVSKIHPDLANPYPPFAAWADLDGDGDPDLVASANTAAQPSGFVALFRNEGLGVFTRLDAGLPQDQVALIRLGDVDGDGRPDVFLLPVSSEQTLPRPSLWRNIDGQRFERFASEFPQSPSDLPVFGDFDGDGDLDGILPVAWDSTVRFYRNDGAGRFLLAENPGFPALSTPGIASAADVDQDGDLDLLISGTNADGTGGTLHLWLNRTVSSNAPPHVPTGLRVLREGGGPVLSWEPAQDAESGHQLTYNIRVGRAPGAGDVLSAVADPGTGHRRLAGPGNNGSALRRVLSQLPSGRYWWTVQSVDPGGAPSPFAAEQVFDVNRPHIEPPQAREFPPGAPAVLSFTIRDRGTPASQLAVEFAVSNTVLFPPEGISWIRDGDQWLLTLSPAMHQSGTSQVTVMARDPDGELDRLEIRVTVRNELAPVDFSLPSLSSATAAFADVDLDGDFDLVLGGVQGQWSTGNEGLGGLWLNQGGRFTSAPQMTLPALAEGAVAFADVNRDRVPDLVVTGGYGNGKLYWGRASSGMIEAGDIPGPFTRSALGWGDADSDGDLDLMALGTAQWWFIESPKSRLYLNRGPQGFLSQGFFSPNLREGTVTWLDADNDGDSDLLLTGSTTSNATGSSLAYFRQDAGVLNPAPLNLPAVSRSAVAVADYDLDGDLDVFVCGWLPGPTGTRSIASLFDNDGIGGFTESTTRFPDLAEARAAWADYDGDGDPDLALAGIERLPDGSQQATTQLWWNDAGVLRPTGNSFPGANPSAIAWADVNGDRRLDLLLVGADSTRIHLNTLTSPAPTRPPVPIALSTSSEGNQTVFSWSMPPGSPRGLTYNLEVGTAPGQYDLMNAAADPASGDLHIPQSGNAGNAGHWRLSLSGKATYYWRVQAVTAAFQASGWSQEAIHDNNNSPPGVEDIPDQIAQLNQGNLQVSIVLSDSESPPEDLAVDVESSNATLLPREGLHLSGDGRIRTLTLSPTPNARGLATVTVRVTDPQGSTATDTFRLIVLSTETVSLPFPSVRVGSLEPVDLERDGVLELFISGSQPLGGGVSRFYASLLRGDSTGFYPSGPSVPPAGDNTFAAWGDFDGDGDPDLLHSGQVFRNADNLLEALPGGPPGLFDGAGAWGDYDNDGDLDLALCDGSLRTRILRNDSGQFIDLQAPLMGVWLGALSWCDTDNDGDLDLLVTGAASTLVAASPQARLYRNDDGVFKEVRAFMGVVGGTIAWGDLNHDGWTDLVYAGSHGGQTLHRCHLNLGDNEFVETPLPPGNPLPGIQLADYNLDGHLDLIRHTTSVVLVHLNDGRGRFAPLAVASANARAARVVASDFTGDGLPDLLAAGTTTGGEPVASLLKNRLILPPPPTPSQPTALVDGSSVHLLWPETLRAGRGAGTTFNLRVGTAPGLGDVVAPMADASNGRRRVSRRGNAGEANQTWLNGLKPGRYFWSVQAIDAGGIGFPFTEEHLWVIEAPLTTPALEQPVREGFVLRTKAHGPPHGRLILERAPDLIHWERLQLLDFDATGTATLEQREYSDTTFWRIRVLP